MSDPVRELVHDHADLNRQVREIGAMLAAGGDREPVGRARLHFLLKDLREHLFLHFAREEEGLFPFVAEWLPELGEGVSEMATAHDAICGALARMVHLAAAGAPAVAEAAAAERAALPGELSVLRGLFERFQAAYADHARREAELLKTLDDRLDAAQRAQLADLVRDL